MISMIGSRRLAIMKVSRLFLESLLPPGKIIDCLEKIGDVDYRLLEGVLKLPYNAKINGVSTNFLFWQDLISVRVECPDFRTVDEGCCIPDVQGYYHQDSKFEFCRWAEGSALVAHYARPQCQFCDKIEKDAKEMDLLKQKALQPDEAELGKSVSIRFREFL